MSAHGRRAAIWLTLLATAVISGCRVTRTYAVVPHPSGGYKADTLRAVQSGNNVYVIFRFDTITHTQTLYRTDTLWKEGTHVIHDTLRLVRRDTVRLLRRDTVRIVRHDTVRLAAGVGIVPVNDRPPRRDTVRIVRTDTVRIQHFDTVMVTVGGNITRVDTVRVPFEVIRTVTHVDTVRRADTVVIRPPPQIITRVDSVIVVRYDTLFVTREAGSGATVATRRTLHVPPGQYPPAGLCRVWVDGTPPGQQRRPAACDALGDIPTGAFILFGGEAYDIDYDWATYGGAPAQIIAVSKKRGKP